MAEEINAMTGGGEPGAVNSGSGGGNQLGQEKTYTQADFDKAIQSEADRRVNQALENQKKQYENDFEERLKTEIEKAEKRAKMSAEERAKEDFENDRKSFEEERARYTTEKMQFECAKLLGELKLPVGFAELLTGKDIEETKSNIKTFEKSFNKAVQAAVEERVKGKAPTTGNGMIETDPFLKGFGG